MKTLKLTFIIAATLLIAGCNKTENNNIIERRSNEENEKIITEEVLSSESELSSDPVIESPTTEKQDSHTTVEKEEFNQVAEQTITIDKCQVEADGEYTDIWTQELLELINNERINNNLNELQYDVTLEECAAIRVKEASQVWSHTRPDGQKWNTVAQGYYRGENLARGYFTAQEVFDAWMASESHRNNILNSQYNTIGISVFNTKRGYVVAAGFGT